MQLQGFLPRDDARLHETLKGFASRIGRPGYSFGERCGVGRCGHPAALAGRAPPAPAISFAAPDPKPTPVPPLTTSSDVDNIDIGGLNSGESVGSELTAGKSGPKASQAAGTKGGGDSSVQVRGESYRAVTTDSAAQSQSASKGTVCTWHDGDREMRAVLLNDVPLPEGEPGTVAVKVADSASGSKDKGGGDSAVLPEFRSESGGGKMTLPGGVILLLDESWDEAALEKFFSSNDIKSGQLTEIEFLHNAYVVETEPGFP